MYNAVKEYEFDMTLSSSYCSLRSQILLLLQIDSDGPLCLSQACEARFGCSTTPCDQISRLMVS